MAYVYILASQHCRTPRNGVTPDLIKRVHEHQSAFMPGFTRRYDVKRLAGYEHTGSIIAAIQREKQMKTWRRNWKIALIEITNSCGHDFYPMLLS